MKSVRMRRNTSTPETIGSRVRNLARNHSRSRLALLGLSLAGIAAIIPLMVVSAVHVEGLFELGDGSETPGSADILGDSVQAGPDWQDIFGADIENPTLHGGISADFVIDDLAIKGKIDSTTFVSGNKNTDPVSNWSWGAGNVPAKDDLSNLYGYATVMEGDLILYLGIERIDPSGDSHLDIEINQSGIVIGVEPDHTASKAVQLCD